jgi:putative ABC transport system permease protein
MSTITEIRAVTGMSLRSIPQRLASSVVIVIGIAGVVGVLVSVLGMARSFSESLIATGHADRAIVMRTGANAEVSSVLSMDESLTVLGQPGVVHDAAGEAIGTRDLVRGVNLKRKADGTVAGITLRGTSPQIFALRPEIEIVEGRMFERGLREIIVGVQAQTEFAGLSLGDNVQLRDSDWTIVGTFVSGDAFESALLADVDLLLSELQRTGSSSVTVLLESPEAYTAFSDAVTTDPTLSVDVMREPEYYAQQSQQLRGILNAVSYFVGGIMAVGALFAALNTMYSAVSARAVEVATLRAIGFGSSGVVIAILSEALLLALVGAALGASVAWLLFGGNTISMGGSVSSAIFELAITPTLLAIGVSWACAVGLIGGLFPALRAARLPIATALRST